MNSNERFSVTVNGTVISVKGLVDGECANGLVTAMDADNIYVIDFNEVSDIKFAGLRALLRCRKAGRRFSIVNAADNVIERFEDTGVAALINVCRRPKPLRIDNYEEFGGGYISKSYNSEDGDSMLKVYGERVPIDFAIREKNIARAVMLFGIPTPLVGTLYSDGKSSGLDFERIEGKHSLSRIISNEPERLVEIATKFANMCKELHATPCDTNIFSDRKIFYRSAINGSKDITEEEKQVALAFLDDVPDSTTCLHGDMQLSNVITNDVDTLWIDLADFGYGNPMLDIGMWYILSVLNSERLMQHIFHLSKAQMQDVWDVFMEVYFGAKTTEEKAEVIKKVEPYAALHMIYLGTTYGLEPGMIDFIREKLVSSPC